MRGPLSADFNQPSGASVWLFSPSIQISSKLSVFAGSIPVISALQKCSRNSHHNRQIFKRNMKTDATETKTCWHESTLKSCILHFPQCSSMDRQIFYCPRRGNLFSQSLHNASHGDIDSLHSAFFISLHIRTKKTYTLCTGFTGIDVVELSIVMAAHTALALCEPMLFCSFLFPVWQIPASLNLPMHCLMQAYALKSSRPTSERSNRIVTGYFFSQT